MLYIINPESNQIVATDAEEVEKITGISAEKVLKMKDGDMITDETENGSLPAKYEVVAEMERC